MQRILTLVFLLAVAVPQLHASGANANIVRWSKGSVQYRNISNGESTGSEDWRISVHPDGSRTLTTTNRVDRSDTVRTVVMRVAENFRPLELFASFWYEGAWVGTSLMTVDGNLLNALATTPSGRITQQVAIPEKFAFIPHPLQSNAWQIWTYDEAAGGPQSSTVYDLMVRLKGPGNMIGPMYESVTTLIGREEITVPAGTFEVDHYKTESGVDMYLTGPDHILVKFDWPAADQEYVLTSLENKNHVVVIGEGPADVLQSFLNSDELKSAMANAGVSSAPDIYVGEEQS